MSIESTIQNETKSEVESAVEPSISNVRSNSSPMSFFDKWLSIWVLLCMAIGGAIGAFVPASARALSLVSFDQINALSAILLWFMILPMLIQIDFETIKAVRKMLGAVALTSSINYLVNPFTMYALAILFFRYLYVKVISDQGLRDEYIAGLILLASAPCTAMVLVWSALVDGDAGYTVVQVAVNDLLLLGLYVPTCVLLIGVSDIPLPWLTIVYSVLLFIVAPMLIAVIARHFIIKFYGVGALDGLVHRFKPVTVTCLLLTLIVTFIFQGMCRLVLLVAYNRIV